ncbi:signal recognition particle-docking protein FtsY [Pseudoteredinibacter isoporae]|uniref:Signal recognition particle receptor FtsY n=2 Tax=Pseudoteredinibacter isoporae TaxID=570281 RepID=A0A7X0MW17_9GAMM|nr:fused signal recognition particle receptor [Pseudoteredinibacter isoporae]NHO85997.1 signal recognition particle-docking protein FtsY [Pseudoteredinibacter isoporae]NIB25552.1 signal recognition particle-docking protein FtsY [Pseudoteredinibacter isoporae]
MVFGFFKKSPKGDAEKTAAEQDEQKLVQEAAENAPEPETSPQPQEAPAAQSSAPQQPSTVATPATVETPAVAEESLQVAEVDEASQEVFMAPEGYGEPEEEKKRGLFARMRAGLAKTGGNLSEGLGNIFMGLKEIDEDLLEELETQLLMADVGIEATEEIMEKLSEQVARKELADTEALYKALQTALADLLMPVQQPLMIDTQKKPFVILVVGVNGVGKTTTIGKLAKGFQNQGKQVMLAAGDTFRAAAVEQLQVWGDRNDVPVVAQHTGADSASVVFDALQSAQSRNIDILIADTAGRLHNKDNLMDELAKVKRVMAKLDDSAPHEVLLVLDAGTGQNAINQAQQFSESSGVTGLALTKLDGTAKGGVIFALAKQLGLPVRFIGVGEGIDDLQPFEAKSFVRALFDQAQAE